MGFTSKNFHDKHKSDKLKKRKVIRKESRKSLLVKVTDIIKIVFF